MKMNCGLTNLIDHETIVRFCRSQRPLRWAGLVERIPDEEATQWHTREEVDRQMEANGQGPQPAENILGGGQISLWDVVP